MRLTGTATRPMRQPAPRLARSGRTERQPRLPGAQSATAAVAKTAAKLRELPFPVFALLIALQIPWIFSFGELRLTPYRFVLIFLLPLCLFRWATGKAGPIRVTDIALLLYALWCTIAIIAIHGISPAIEPAGIIFIETVGGFLVARCYIRDAKSFYLMAKLLFVICMCLLPFALHETFTGGKLLLNAFRLVMPTYIDVSMPERWGLDRTQGNFIHPIHFGVNTGAILTLTFLVVGYGRSTFMRYVQSGLVFLTSFMSLSSGPLTSMIGQIGLLTWNRIARGFPLKWSIFAFAGVGLFLFAEVFSNRSLATILIGYFAFDEYSAYIRTLTWQYGTMSIMDHPLFGVGFGDWARPAWLTWSIDMHWIVDSIRHGMPAGFLTFLSFFAAVIAIGRKPLSDEKLKVYRTAYMVTMSSFFMTGWAVYFWESSYVLYTFLLGSGFWLLDVNEGTEPERRRARTVTNDKGQSDDQPLEDIKRSTNNRRPRHTRA